MNSAPFSLVAKPAPPVGDQPHWQPLRDATNNVDVPSDTDAVSSNPNPAPSIYLALLHDGNLGRRKSEASTKSISPFEYFNKSDIWDHNKCSSNNNSSSSSSSGSNSAMQQLGRVPTNVNVPVAGTPLTPRELQLQQSRLSRDGVASTAVASMASGHRFHRDQYSRQPLRNATNTNINANIPSNPRHCIASSSLQRQQYQQNNSASKNEPTNVAATRNITNIPLPRNRVIFPPGYFTTGKVTADVPIVPTSTIPSPLNSQFILPADCTVNSSDTAATITTTTNGTSLPSCNATANASTVPRSISTTILKNSVWKASGNTNSNSNGVHNSIGNSTTIPTTKQLHHRLVVGPTISLAHTATNGKCTQATQAVVADTDSTTTGTVPFDQLLSHQNNGNRSEQVLGTRCRSRRRHRLSTILEEEDWEVDSSDKILGSIDPPPLLPPHMEIILTNNNNINSPLGDHIDKITATSTNTPSSSIAAAVHSIYEAKESATIAVTTACVGSVVDASEIQPTIDAEHARPPKRNSAHLSCGGCAKKTRMMAVDPIHTSTMLLPPPTLRNPPKWFHKMKSDPSPFQAAECRTGVMHISSSNSMKHYHMWVTDKSLVPNATQYFAGNGFNNVTFVAFGDRNKYTSLYDKKAPLCIEDLVNNKLFESMELDPNAGKNFHPGVFSPMKKRMHGHGYRRRKQITTRPIFSCDRDNATSAGMVASGEGGRMGCSLEERGKVTDEARADIEADEMVALGVSHVPRSTVEVGGKKRRLNNSPLVETPTPSQSLLFSSSSLSTLSSSLPPPPPPPPMPSTSTQLDPIEVCFDDNHSNDNGKHATAGHRRLKKPRKIVIDTNQTQLSNEHMNAMLRDTSDLVLENVPHLADWTHDDNVEDGVFNSFPICDALQSLPTKQLLARPCIGDNGQLAPELLALWRRGARSPLHELKPSWKTQYLNLVRFKKQQGHCNVMLKYKSNGLGRWVHNVSGINFLLLYHGILLHLKFSCLVLSFTAVATCREGEVEQWGKVAIDFIEDSDA